MLVAEYDIITVAELVSSGSCQLRPAKGSRAEVELARQKEKERESSALIDWFVETGRRK